MNLNLTGKTALITGASQGIGAAIARTFAQEGCSLVLVALFEQDLTPLRQQIQAEYNVDIRIHAADLTAPGCVQQLAKTYSDIDILINNAGAIPSGDLWEVDEKKWHKGWNLKVLGYINLTREIYTNMKKRGHGVILNNIGNGGENFDFHYIAGTSGNAALMAFTRALGGKSLGDGIRVLGVNPGPVASERINNMMRQRAQSLFNDAERYTEFFKNLPLGRAASMEEIADLVVFLASPRSSYTSGVIVTIDGGATSNKSVA